MVYQSRNVNFLFTNTRFLEPQLPTIVATLAAAGAGELFARETCRKPSFTSMTANCERHSFIHSFIFV